MQRFKTTATICINARNEFLHQANEPFHWHKRHMTQLNMKKDKPLLSHIETKIHVLSLSNWPFSGC